METKNYNINDLIFAEYNPRKINDKQKQDLTDSIKRFGFVEPVIVNVSEERKNIIISGHQRVKVAKEMGIQFVPCVELDLTRDKEKELNVRMNKAGGEWDWDILNQNFEVPELVEFGFLENEIIGADIIDDIDLPAGDKSPHEQMTFILTAEQKTQLDNAMAKAKEMGEFIDTHNENSNGNAIARVCENFNGRC